MLVKNPQSKGDLQERTRQRNATVWTALDWGGVMAPISQEMELLNRLRAPMIEAFIAETEEIFSIKEYKSGQAGRAGSA